MKKYNRQELYRLISKSDEGYDLIDYILELQDNSIPKKKIEEKLLYIMELLSNAELGDLYDEVRDIKEELLFEDK